jgi:dTDP-4-amino-4,6-dideoxygalactose transaminase
MTEPIHLFVPTFRVQEVLDSIRECLERGWTGLGYKTVEFEEAWRRYTGLPHSHFVNSATSGLHLAVKLLKEAGKWRDGDEIISTPLTFVSTNHAILYERLTPRFADVDDYLCLDPQSVEARINRRTRAVMFVGMGGNVGQYAAVRELCRKRGLKLILDASHMSGTRQGPNHAGHDADVAVFSFQAVKNLPTSDSGMVCFADADLDREVRKWSWLGIDKDTFTRTVGTGSYRWLYDVEHVGFKYHGNALTAAVALVELKYLDADNEVRRRVAGWYDQELAGNEGVEPVPMAPGCLPSRHLYQIEVDNRDQVMVELNRREIYPGVHYRDNTTYAMYRSAAGTCPRSHRASERVISLPMHLKLTRDHVARIGGALREIVSSVPRGVHDRP